MDDLLAARSTMAFSLGFHIIFAAIGMTMPFFMSAAHYRWLKTKNPVYLELTKMWMKGVGVLFAVGAVSGTVISFQLGLLWPGFMKVAGPVIGMPFSWEGSAFFLEAVCIGLFLYGWKRMKPWTHWFTGLLVGIAGFSSGIFVVAANGWMNTPSGFQLVPGAPGNPINIDLWAAMFNKAWLHQTIHMQLAALQAVGFAVAGMHALLYLRGRAQELNLGALKIALAFGAIASILMPFSGHFAGQRIAEYQPAKFAAAEAHFNTTTHAPLVLGGIVDEKTGTVRGSIEIPGLLSFLTYNTTSAEVKGLNDIPLDQRPPVAITHYAFQLMVLIGGLLALMAIIYFVCLKRRRWPRWFLRALTICVPLGFIALESGWIVTEVGRQPWIVQGILRTKDTVTPVPGMQYHFILFVVLYLILAFATLIIFKRLIRAAQQKFEITTPATSTKA